MPAIDYDQLATQHGGVPDYDALAAQHGGSSAAGPSPFAQPSRDVIGGRTLSIPDTDHSAVANFARWLESRVDSLENAFQRFREPGLDAKLGAASDVVRNVGEAAAPLALPAAVAAPFRTGAAVLGGAAAGLGAEKGAEALNIPPGTSEAIGTAASLAGGAAAHRIAGAVSDTAARVATDPAVRQAVSEVLPTKVRKAFNLAGAVKRAAVGPVAAPAAEDTELLDNLAQGFGAKSFAKLKPEEQATVRDLAQRIKTGAAPPAAPPASSSTGPGMTPEVLPPERRLGPGAVQMPPAEDTSFVRSVQPGRGLARDPKTGRMMRVYSSTDQPIQPAAAAPSVAQPADTANPNSMPAAQTAPPAAAVDHELAKLPSPEPKPQIARTREEANLQYQQKARAAKAERMARLLYYGGTEQAGVPTPGAGVTVEDAAEMMPKRESFASDAEFQQAQQAADQHWQALAKAEKIAQLQKNGGVSQSDLSKLNNVEPPSDQTKRLVMQQLDRYWQAHHNALQNRPPAGFSMGAMKRYRTDYNPAALTDQQIQALHQ